MMDCTVLERPGRWRAASTVVILCLSVLPAAPLLSLSLLSAAGGAPFAGPAFLRALGGSLGVGAAVAAIGLVVGLPAGLLAALHEFPGRRVLLALTTLPLITPSFLWAIGWSRLAIRVAPAASEALSWMGPYLVFGALTVPLVLWASFAAALTLRNSQLDAARLAGGEGVALRNAAREAAVPALLAALLGGVLTLSDAGADQIFGAFRAASQILASFSAQHDYELAGRQCLALTGMVFALATPVALFAAPRVAAAVLSRQVERPGRKQARGVAGLATVLFLIVILLGTALPLVGLVLPLLAESDFDRAFSLVERTLADTVIYAGGGGAIAVFLGFAGAFAVGRSGRLCTLAIAFSIAAFSLPPALSALGVLQLGTQAPAWTDLLLRSKATVCLGLGLRFLPVALLLGLRGWATMSPSWALAAGVHGVPLPNYVVRVVLPHLAPAAAAAFLLVALLSAADLTTVLLLHPPGASSFSLSIFTVMANARESLVASLCATYFVMAVAVLALGCSLSRAKPWLQMRRPIAPKRETTR